MKNGKLARRIVLKHVLSTFEIPSISDRGRKASVSETEEIFKRRYEDIVAAVITDGNIVAELIEDMVNENRLQIHNGAVYYKDRKIL